MSGLEQRVVLAPEDGSLGPLLRIADDRLDPRAGYGRHSPQAVDVVAVVLAGVIRHRWGDGAELSAGDVAVLRAGSGLTHDEVAGDDGARVLQCYLRPADPAAPPRHEVHRDASGWVDLGRADAALWVVRSPAGVPVEVPDGLLLQAGAQTVVAPHEGGGVVPSEDVTLVLWRLETGCPDWATD